MVHGRALLFSHSEEIEGKGRGAIYHAPWAWLRALLRVTPVIWFRLSAHLRQTGWLDQIGQVRGSRDAQSIGRS